MILTSIIPSSIFSALRTYIRNYVDSLNNPQKAYLNFFDFSSESVTDPNPDEWIELNMVATEGFSFDGLELASSGAVTNVGGQKIIQMEGIFTLSGANNREVHLAFFKNGTLLPCSEQSVTLNSSGKHSPIPIQCVTDFETGEAVQVYVKQIDHSDTITLLNANVIITQL